MDDLASQEGLRHINLTDKDARLMKTRHGIVPGYNAQSMVSPIEVDDEASGMLITAVDVVDDPTDYGQFTPMLEQAEETTGTKACMTLADAGYYSGSNLSECAGRGQGVAMPEPSQRQSRGHPYHKDRFAYDESSDSFMCPQGKALPFERIHISSKGAHFRFYLIIAFVAPLLLVQRVVIVNHSQRVDAVPGGGLQLGKVIPEAAVTGEAHHRAVRHGTLGPHGRRKGPAQRAGATQKHLLRVLRVNHGAGPDARGIMVSEGKSKILEVWWLSFFPGIAITVVVLAINLFGDWLRVNLDPKLWRI